MEPDELDDLPEADDDVPDLQADLAAALRETGDAGTDDAEQAAAKDDGAAAESDDTDDTEDSDTSDQDESDEEAVAASDDQETGGEEDSDSSEDGETDEAEETPLIDPPASMSEVEKEAFATMPREAQDFLVRREKERDADYTSKTKEVAEDRKSAEAWAQAVEPFKPYIASLRATPQEAFRALLGAEYTLRNGSPEQKGQALTKLARDYNIDLGSLAEQYAEDGDPPDPAMNQVNERLARIERQAAEDTRRAAEQVNTNALSAVEAFGQEKDAEGNLLRPYFEEVRSAMSVLITNGDMQTAYEDAVWANPKLRADLLVRQEKETLGKADRVKAEATKKAQAERARKAREAKKAASAVKSSSQPTSPKADDTNVSLHDDIQQEWDRAAAS